MANNNDLTVFAETNYRDRRQRFGIMRDDRRRHMYVIGKTGMGKSTLLQNMVIGDINAGNGFCLVDPHGDFADMMLDYIPAHRINDVVYFDPADRDYPIAFNVMESIDPEYTHLVAAGLVGVFKKIWADSWGPRLEYLLRNSILALIEAPNSTLLGVLRMFTDKDYRMSVLEHVKDPVVRSFWLNEYANYPDRMQAEAISPIQNKVGQFLSIGLIRNIVGQTKSSIDVRELMDQKKIVLMNLAKGRIGEDASALFGAMFVTKVQLAAMSRTDMDEEDREDFYLYVDEFQNFATDSFADILSEARKYRLCLIMAHQYIAQLEERVRDAVFGNVGTLVAFRVGAGDAEYMSREFEPVFSETDLVNLPKFQIMLKLMINGVASQAFSAATLPPQWEPQGNREKVLRSSRERYANERSKVEEAINKWAGVNADGTIPSYGGQQGGGAGKGGGKGGGRGGSGGRGGGSGRSGGSQGGQRGPGGAQKRTPEQNRKAAKQGLADIAKELRSSTSPKGSDRKKGQDASRDATRSSSAKGESSKNASSKQEGGENPFKKAFAQAMGETASGNTDSKRSGGKGSHGKNTQQKNTQKNNQSSSKERSDQRSDRTKDRTKDRADTTQKSDQKQKNEQKKKDAASDIEYYDSSVHLPKQKSQDISSPF